MKTLDLIKINRRYIIIKYIEDIIAETLSCSKTSQIEKAYMIKNYLLLKKNNNHIYDYKVITNYSFNKNINVYIKFSPISSRYRLISFDF